MHLLYLLMTDAVGITTCGFLRPLSPISPHPHRILIQALKHGFCEYAHTYSMTHRPMKTRKSYIFSTCIQPHLFISNGITRGKRTLQIGQPGQLPRLRGQWEGMLNFLQVLNLFSQRRLVENASLEVMYCTLLKRIPDRIS